MYTAGSWKLCSQKLRVCILKLTYTEFPTQTKQGVEPIAVPQPVETRDHGSNPISDELSQTSSDCNSNIFFISVQNSVTVNSSLWKCPETLASLLVTPRTIHFNRLRLQFDSFCFGELKSIDFQLWQKPPHIRTRAILFQVMSSQPPLPL
jgi:hypothetical protein